VAYYIVLISRLWEALLPNGVTGSCIWPSDPTEKLDALAMGTPPTLKRGRFQVPDKLMTMFKEVGRPV
jgi:hypothetical protein